MRSWKRRTRYLQKKLRYVQRCDLFLGESISKWWKKRQYKYPDLYPYFPWGLKSWRRQYFFEQKKNSRAYFADYKLLSRLMDYDGLYVESCSYHPCKVITLSGNEELHDISIDVQSLVNGNVSGCSYYHCGIIILTKEEAEERRDFLIKYGTEPYLISYASNKLDPDKVISHLAEWIYITKMYDGAGSPTPTIPPVTEDGKIWLKENFDIDYDDVMLSVEKKFKEPIDADSRSLEES